MQERQEKGNDIMGGMGGSEELRRMKVGIAVSLTDIFELCANLCLFLFSLFVFIQVIKCNL